MAGSSIDGLPCVHSTGCAAWWAIILRRHDFAGVFVSEKLPSTTRLHRSEANIRHHLQVEMDVGVTVQDEAHDTTNVTKLLCH